VGVEEAVRLGEALKSNTSLTSLKLEGRAEGKDRRKEKETRMVCNGTKGGSQMARNPPLLFGLWCLVLLCRESGGR